MASDPKIKVVGLHTNGNVNSTVPPGALTQADDTVLRSNGVLEPRRGFGAETGTLGTSTVPKAITFYADGRIAHYTDSGSYKLAYSTAAGASWNALSSTYTPVDPTLLRMKFVEANQNLYFNTSVGMKVITSISSTPAKAGIPTPVLYPNGDSVAGLEGDSDSTSNILPKNSAVAYRAVFGIKDANNNLKLGAPSDRVVVSNPNDVVVATGGLVRATNVVTATVTSHGFLVGDRVIITNPSGSFSAAGPFTVTVVTATTFKYAETAADATSGIEYTISSGSKATNITATHDKAELTTSHFVRFYRTLIVSGANTDPGDEMFQIYEAKIPADVVSDGRFNFNDSTPESQLYSSPLYTNPKTGDGISSAGTRAPLSRDFVLWADRLWLANTTDCPRYSLQILGIGSPDGIQTGDLIAIDGRIYDFYTAGGSGVAGYADTALYTTSTSLSTNIARTRDALVFAINDNWRTSSGTPVRAYSTQGFAEAPGKMMIEGPTPASSTFYVAASRPDSFNPAVATLFPLTEASSARTSSTNITATTASTHDFLVGDSVYLASNSADANFPVGIKTVTAKTGTTFSYTEAGSGTPTMTGVYAAYKITSASDNSRRPHGIMYSKYQEPEAVPLANYFTVGAKNKQILRIVPLREKLFVFKEDGLFTVSGQPPYHSVDSFDPTCRLLTPDSAVVLGGKIYAFTRQGVVAISESGVGVISYPIEGDLLPYQLLTPTQYSDGYGAAYESDRLYIFSPSVTSMGARQYVFNYMTQGWTSWTLAAQDMGVDPKTDKLTYLPYNVADAKASVERKTGTYADYYDTTGAVTISAATATTLTLNTSLNQGTLIVSSDSVPCLLTSSGTSPTYVTASGFSTPATGAGTYYVACTPTVKFARNTLGQPGITKHWKEVTFHFGLSNIYRVSGTFATTEGQAGTSTTDPGTWLSATTPTYTRSARALVPLTCQRSVSLQVGFGVSQGYGLWRLDGITYDVELISQRVQK